MSRTPDAVDAHQLADLHIQTVPPEGHEVEGAAEEKTKAVKQPS